MRFVRVIMVVANFRLDYKQFVLWYSSVPQFTVQTPQWMQLVMAVIHFTMCVRVIMGVDNCRLYYKQSVFWYCSVPDFIVHAVACVEPSSVFVTRQWEINWITWFFFNIEEILCVIFVFYNDSSSLEFKFYWITKDVTLNCLPLLSSLLCLL